MNYAWALAPFAISVALVLFGLVRDAKTPASMSNTQDALVIVALVWLAVAYGRWTA